MKKIIYAVLLLSAIFSSSCSKDEGYVENIDEKDLTPCPQNYDCKYYYSERSNVEDNSIMITKGKYRVFWSESGLPGFSIKAFILAPVNGTSFYLSEKQVLAGRIKYLSNCPACFSIPLEIGGGYSKGRLVNAANGTGSQKWLLETKLYLKLAGSQTKTFIDTVFVKQYYYLNQQ